MYIYAEFILIENLIINYIILYITNRFTSKNIFKTRLFFAALLGSIFSVLFLYFEDYLILKPLMKLFLSFIMILLAFKSQEVIMFLKQIAVFYITSFTFAGAILGLYYLFQESLLSGVDYINIYKSARYIILGIILGIILIISVFKIIKYKSRYKSYEALVRINLNDKVVEFNALVDSGNSLTEPISGKPVIVCEYNVLKEFFPESLNKIYTSNKLLDYDIISDLVLDLDSNLRIRVIPYKSIGQDFGLLLGFIPDFIEVKIREETKKIDREVVVAIHNEKLDINNLYSGLLSPETIGG